MSESNSVITTKKVSSSVAGYIWDSPCLKPIIYNPFLLSGLILLVIWVIDLFYGKTFTSSCVSTLFQHMVTTYVIVAVGVALNNMLIKHRYRTDKYNEKQAEAKSEEPSEPITAEYV